MKLAPDGNATRCTSSVRSLGNFFEDPHLLSMDSMPCVFSRCGCISDGVRMASKQERASIREYSREFLREIPPYMVMRYSPERVVRYLNRRLSKYIVS